MTKTATTIEEQISKLESRGLTISDKEKAKEYLLDIGYYRLGFYLFPFEKSYPRKKGRDHQYKDGTNIEFAIEKTKQLLDFIDSVEDAYNALPLIEINFRTKLIYEVSNHYKEDPFWYVNDKVVERSFIENDIYKKEIEKIKDEDVIKKDISEYKRNIAPAWKAIEFFSLGTIIMIFDNIKDKQLKHKIAKHYGLSQSDLSNYLNTLKKIRNNCAHGKVIFDMTFPKAISSGPAGELRGEQKTSIYGAYKVLSFMIEKISSNRHLEMDKAILAIFNEVKQEKVCSIIKNNLGFIDNLQQEKLS